MSLPLASVRRRGAAWAASAAALAALLAGCAGVPLNPPRPAPSAVPPAGTPSDVLAPSAPGAALLRPRSRWQPVDWSELPGWESDRVLEAWSALYRSCERPPQGWSALCAEVLLTPPADESAARAWLQARLQPYRVESPEGATEGLVTGYYEPLIEASRMPRGGFAVPLHRPPADLGTRKPYWTRQQLDSLPAAAAALRGREIAYVADPLDALVLQIQGSGRLRITEADGRQRTVRLAFAGHNDQPYKSVGRWLIEQGEIRAEQASWPGIKAWARANPRRVQELLWSNPRVVFFREEPLPDPQAGPRGAQGVALTPGRSIAVDPQSIPYGTPVWLSSTEPLSTQALQRLVVAQDTGSAIVGAVRADFFWGWGEQAEQQAGRMKQPLRLWVLWPRGPQS
ncbi:murein transglycosylase A [Azohydromonas lata]|uniref:peptidoglycan lytic exotransglycosylase n=1 Tax=Azohydromonas lata TaxID=45677 RepID=A0ABU5INK5_9BURK|nr:MltA domain-containing protein [Azohydromonas lata]MDZ5460491.1 MltA domain-containing protein [Azohydromonas lata]